MKRHEMTDEFKEYEGRKVYRIRALEDGYHHNKGERGGFIEGEFNLPQDERGWVADNAIVYGDAIVCQNGFVGENSAVRDVTISGTAIIIGNSQISGQIFLSCGMFANAIINSDNDWCSLRNISGMNITAYRTEKGVFVSPFFRFLPELKTGPEILALLKMKFGE